MDQFDWACDILGVLQAIEVIKIVHNNLETKF